MIRSSSPLFIAWSASLTQEEMGNAKVILCSSFAGDICIRLAGKGAGANSESGIVRAVRPVCKSSITTFMNPSIPREASMKLSHVHCRVRDLHEATHWFEKVWQITPLFNNERMAWLPFGDLGVILDAAPDDSIVTIGFDSNDCDADYRLITSRGAEPIEAPQDRPWGSRAAYLRGPGGLTLEIEQLLNRT
jgi:predicted enzyme related to lactoylglutathione lyase